MTPFQPTLNACLNAASAVLVFCGYLAIRKRRIHLHKRLMLGGLACSAAFLVSYLIYHFRVGTHHYPGTGFKRHLYLAILLSHTILAVAVVPLVGITLYRALKGRFEKHKRLARWTLPVWLYVSITGVVIYAMLY